MIISFRKIVYILFSLLISGNLAAQVPVINEVCASNISIISDEDGDFSDWIEIYNPGPSAVNLEGYALSDRKDSLMKWVFPAYILESGKHLLVFASGKQVSEAPTFWNAVITKGDSWKYVVPGSEFPASWRTMSFTDSGWLTGNTGIGYGDGDDATVIDPAISVFMRKKFNISNIADIEELIFHIDYDDAFVAYLNGTEICRANIGTAGTPPAFDAVADSYIEPSMINGGRPAEFDLTSNISLLRDGENLLAIQLHNQSISSSDLTVIPFLSFRSKSKVFDDPIPVLGLNSKTFHANFKIDKDGDSIYFTSPSKSLLQLFPVEYNAPDMSLGFPDDAGTVIKAFPEPTPWFTNAGTAYNLTRPGDLVVSPTSGYYTSGVSVSLSSLHAGDEIYYTLDGTDPTTSSRKYSSPVTIIGNNTLKARILNPGYLPGEISTNTYYTKKTNGLPAIFITTPPANLWDVETGIYVKGNNASTDYPYFGANFWEDWEKPAYIEYFNPDGTKGFSINAGIKIFGGWSRGNDLRSLSIFARSEYGNKNISYKLFENKDIDKFEALVLRNSGNECFWQNNQSGVHFRDLVMTSLAGLNNVDYMAGRPVSVFLNGQYWGILNMREKINEHFVADNHPGIDPDKVNLLIGNKSIIQGSNTGYIQLEDFIQSNSMAEQQNYEFVKTQMDIDNFINYEVAQIYYFNGDWPGNNIKFWKADVGYSKWRWIIYDTDFGMGLWDVNKVFNNSLDFATTTTGPDWPNPAWSTFLLRNLLLNQEFKNQFINTFADRMNTVFLPDYVNGVIDYHANLIREEMKDHIGRWGGSQTQWQYNIDQLKSFAGTRPSLMRGYIRQFFDIPYSRTLVLRTEGGPGAGLNLNTLILDEFPWSGYYYYDIPVTIRAISPDGYRFVRWEGSVESTEREITYDMISNADIKAIFEPWEKTEYEGVLINEIAYNNPQGSKDWVEIFNNSTEIKDISGWTIKDSNEDNFYKIPERTLLLPYDYLVLVEDMESFYNANSDIPNFRGETKFGLDKEGECVFLYNRKMEVVDSVCYASEYPWPESPLETGNPIALRNPNTDNNVGFNWSPALDINGTPGGANLMNHDNPVIAGEDVNGLMLYQNYPNPFSNETTIMFRMSKPGKVNIRIYNIQGSLVSEIFSGNLPEGLHKFDWNAENRESGIYILNLSDSNSTYQKRMLLSK